jgi:hypothetical protein
VIDPALDMPEAVGSIPNIKTKSKKCMPRERLAEVTPNS